MYRKYNLGKRRVVLATLGFFAISRALAYVPFFRKAPLQEPLLEAAAGIPQLMWLYVVAWALAGAACFAYLRSGHLVRPVSLIVGMMFAWGMIWAIGWFTDVHDNDYWQTAITYWGTAIAIMTLCALTPNMPNEVS